MPGRAMRSERLPRRGPLSYIHRIGGRAMLSPELLMELAKEIRSGIENTEQELRARAEGQGDAEDVSPSGILSGRVGGVGIVDSFAEVYARLFAERSTTEEDIAVKLGCPLEHVRRLGERVLLRPSRELVVALCLALELAPEEAEELLHAGGYELSAHEVYDIAIRFCLERDIFDLEDVNEALECFNLQGISPRKLATELERRYGPLGEP